MILKRLLATALGALGLGALAAGPAFSQAPGSSNIPAPDVFDDQITCTQLLPNPMAYNLPSDVPMGGMTSPLDDIIGEGENTLDATALGAITGLTDGPAKLLGLGYVIPAGNMNCGAGAMGPTLATGATAMNIDAGDGMGGGPDGDFLDAGDTLVWGSIPKDVADGYSDLLTKYTAVYGDPDATTGGTLRALEAAQKLLDETDASLTALVESRTAARNTARDVHNRALTAFNAASRGPIYQAAVAEWNAKASVTQAIADYNDQVTKTNTARTTLNTMQYSVWNVADAAGMFAVSQGDSKYVPLADSSLVSTVVTIAMGMGTVNFGMALADYAGGTENAPVFGTAGVPATGTMNAEDSDPDAGTAGTNSNFTALGALIVPMNAWDHDTDSATPTVLRNTVSANGANVNSVGTVRDTVMNTRIAAAALKKARDENTNPRFQELYNEAYRRAMLEQNYYDALWAQVLADTTDTRTAQQKLRYVDTDGSGINEIGEQTADNINNATNSSATAGSYYEPAPLTISSRSAAYTTESNKRMANETSLRGLVATREMATEGVLSQFTNAQAFYQQLVDRRTALKVAADAAAPEGATELTDAQKAADMALMTARTEKTKIDSLYPDDPDDPTVDLVSELLKTGGDDGQALVDAISSTYDDTQSNKDEIDTLKGQLTDADGNPIDLSNLGNAEEITALTTDVGQNSDDITALDGRVAANESDIGQIQTDLYGTTSGQHDDLAACDGTGLLNVATCADARSRHNADDIEGVGDLLEQKKDYIDNLGEAIGVDPVTGEGTGEDGMSRIDMNAKAIADETQARKDADTALGERIDKEAMDRKDADDALGGRIDKEVMDRTAADDALGGRIDKEVMDRTAADDALGGRIDKEAMDRMGADTALGERIDKEAMDRADADVMLGGMIMDEEMARMEADTMLGGMISAEEMARMEADTALGGRISSNADAIASNMNSIGQNRSMINDNRNMIGELSDDLDVVRAGVAASMALAGMPAINGRGIAIGVGSYDGESAFAVGFQIQGEQASFKIGVTSSGGETGASAGVGFNF